MIVVVVVSLVILSSVNAERERESQYLFSTGRTPRRTKQEGGHHSIHRDRDYILIKTDSGAQGDGHLCPEEVG